MRLYYFAPIPGIPMADQEQAATKDGWKPDHAATYKESRNSYPKEARKAIDACRKSARDHIWVYELAVIVPRQPYLKLIRKLLAGRSAHLVEGKTQRRSDRAVEYSAMLEVAAKKWTRKFLASVVARKLGAKGGKAKGKSFRERRLPASAAMLIWHSKAFTEEEALHKINDVEGYDVPWSRSAAFRHLGKRGSKMGPRPKI